jgi:hypothetical protein
VNRRLPSPPGVILWPEGPKDPAGPVASFVAALLRMTAVFSFAFASSACGYHAVYGGEGSERVAVVLVRGAVADSIAAGEVASGVREELARDGSLAAGSGYPRVEIEVTRIDEASEGIAVATTGAANATRVPLARGSEVGVVARAWVVQRAGGEHERDTGDVRALVAAGATTSAEATGSADSTAIDALRHDDAVRAAARMTGVRLARRILGRPAPEVDVLDDRRATP